MNEQQSTRKEGEQPDKLEIVIFPKRQESIFDCGQTVLDMLGYNGHEICPDHEISSRELLDIPGSRIILPTDREGELDYNYPKVLIILRKGKAAGAKHWVIRHKDKIYCPIDGVMEAEEYEKRCVSSVLQEFEIPVVGQQTPEEFYGQH